DGQEIKIRRAGKTIIDLNKIKFNYQEAQAWRISHADNDKITLTGTFPPSVDFYRHVEDSQPRVAEVTISREPDGFRMHASPEWGRQVTMEFDYLGDHFF